MSSRLRRTSVTAPLLVAAAFLGDPRPTWAQG